MLSSIRVNLQSARSDANAKGGRLKRLYSMDTTKIFSTESLTDLQDFMFDTMLPADDCVDWFCDRHDVSATDEVIDFVVDAHFAFHGE